MYNVSPPPRIYSVNTSAYCTFAAQSVHPLQSLQMQSAAVMGSRTAALQSWPDEKREVKTYLERKTILNEIVCI